MMTVKEVRRYLGKHVRAGRHGEKVTGFIREYEMHHSMPGAQVKVVLDKPDPRGIGFRWAELDDVVVLKDYE